MSITVKIENLSNIRAAFAAAPVKMTNELDRAVGKTVMEIERQAKREAPVNKNTGGGTLRQSIRGSRTGTASGKVEVGAKYGVFVHEGTRPHMIRIKHKKVLANRRTNQIFGKVVRHPGTRANPFMERAVENASGKIKGYFNDAVKRAIKL